MLLLRRLAPWSPASRERDADSTPPSRAADPYPGACRPGLSRTRLPCQDRSRIHRNLKSLGGLGVGVLVYCHSPLRRRFLPLSVSPRCRHYPGTPSPSQSTTASGTFGRTRPGFLKVPGLSLHWNIRALALACASGRGLCDPIG